MARRRSPAPIAAVATAATSAGVPAPSAAPVTVPDRTGAAFFDVDNTMMQGASLYYFARGLAARRYFTTIDLARFAISQARFRLLAAEHSGDIAQAREAALAFIAGWQVDDVQRLSEEIFDELMADRIWSGTRALADQHLAAGQRVWLVTAAPVELGRVIAARLGLTGALGTVAEIHDGAYTGRLVGEMLHGPAKAHAIEALAAAEGLDLTRCTAYSDSINDVPMLTTVGRAVAVNPDGALRRMARLQGWDIRDFRHGRKAAKVAVPVALGAGVVAGAVAGGMALSRRRKKP
ncbi:HAD-IB family hydrolase [Catellatospora sp. NPDC049609]|uniref:HAD family hydrolase n=1 Tax=Catellatospora sp. NPDC049609 TaxID=3155505 RepID=UPI003433FDC7